MNCKEFEKRIPDFIKQKMDYETLKEFDGHMSSCERCKEELTIQFLVTEGMQRLEEGDAFDLYKELEARLLDAKKKRKWHQCILGIGMLFEFFAVAFIAAAVVWLLI
ncbi:MAG: zf-HC2 domain-containing protein [Roseburia sp.]|nr:zf-HC2 domain-containing protein [Roseburia sp.]